MSYLQFVNSSGSITILVLVLAVISIITAHIWLVVVTVMINNHRVVPPSLLVIIFIWHLVAIWVNHCCSHLLSCQITGRCRRHLGARLVLAQAELCSLFCILDLSSSSFCVMDQLVVFFGSACKNSGDTDSHNKFIEDSSNDHSVFCTIFDAEHVTQDQFTKFLSLRVIELKERNHDFEEFEDRFMQLFRCALVLEKHGNDLGYFSEESLQGRVGWKKFVLNLVFVDVVLVLVYGVVVSFALQHTVELNRRFHVENESSNCIWLSLGCFCSETHEEHLEHLGECFEFRQNFGHVQERLLSSCSDFLVRIVECWNKLNDKWS